MAPCLRLWLISSTTDMGIIRIVLFLNYSGKIKYLPYNSGRFGSIIFKTQSTAIGERSAECWDTTLLLRELQPHNALVSCEGNYQHLCLPTNLNFKKAV